MPTRLDVAALRADFKKAASDRVVTRPEVRAIIRRARRGRLHESEAKALRRAARTYRDAFSSPAGAELAAFIDRRMNKLTVLDGPPAPLGEADPRVLKADRARLEQQRVKNAQLFRHGVSGSDPEQNYLGDCYLMGAMSAVAHLQPRAIETAFRAEADGTFTVRLFDLRGRPHLVHIDADLPRNGWYGYYYGRARDPKELWPALLEKAFAKWKGGYQAIEGGVPGDAMSALTGRRSRDLFTRAGGESADQIFEALQRAIVEKRPAIAATLSQSSAKLYLGSGLHADHTYAVFGTSVRHGERYVKLRNPWGEGEPAGQGRDDGVFELELPELMKYMSNVSING